MAARAIPIHGGDGNRRDGDVEQRNWDPTGATDVAGIADIQRMTMACEQLD